MRQLAHAPGTGVSAPPGIAGVTPVATFLDGLADGDERARWEADLSLADAFISRFGWCARHPRAPRRVRGRAGLRAARAYRP